MKKNLRNVVIALLLFLMPAFLFGQAPNLGAASSFVVFTSAGAFNNTGPSILTGDVGSYNSSPVGLAVFPNPPAPGLVKNGSIYGPVPSPSLATIAQRDAVISAYSQLGLVGCGTTLVLPLAGQILTPGVYCYGAAATLNGEITLDGQGDPNALFIIKMGGAFATVGGSNVKLINSASPNNVYWQINGAFNLVTASTFRGTVIANGAINMLGTATLVGKALTQAGDIAIAANIVTLGTPPVAPTITLTQPTCALATGTITITAPTGVGMTYSINGTTYTNTTGIFAGLAPGTYNVTAMNSDGYVSPRTSVTINAAPAALTGSAAITTAILCNGSTATVTLTGAGGSGPLSYTFNGVTNGTGIFNGINAGLAYPWIVSDLGGGCAPVSGNITVTQPLVLGLTSAAVSSPILCNGGTATVTIVANGGTAPYSYTFNGVTNATGIFNGVTAGLAKPYSITDFSGCGPVTGNINVSQPLVLALTSAAVSSPILCNGGTATVTIAANGGTAPYSYTFNGVTNATGIFNGVLAGLNQPYSINDFSGCGPVTGNINVTQPLVLALTSAAVTSPILCNGGGATVTIVANGGTAPYSYTFNGQTNATGIFNGVLAGLNKPYSITDFRGCGPVTGTLTITQPIPLSVATTQTNVLCFGSATGSATATPIGGSAPYIYSWNTIPVKTTATASNLLAGTYAVTVTDNKGCSSMALVVINQPVASLMVNTMKTDVMCFGSKTGNATAIPIGGSAPYSYSWNTIPVQTTATASNLSSGNYIVTVTDKSGCMATANVSIQQASAGLMVSTTQVDVLCFGSSSASATALPQGGTAPYSYSWNTVPVQTTATASNLSSGNYIVTVTDNSGCMGTANVFIQQASAGLIVSTTQVDVLCYGGSSASATALPQGGTAPYSYSWNIIPVQTTATASNLSSGNYIVTVTDNSGCMGTANVFIQQPLAALMVSTTQINGLCFGSSSASATVLVQGGSAPYSYSWNTIPVQTTATASNLSSGNYIVTVTDNSGCMATANVSIQQPLAELMVSTTQVDVLCFGSSSASATALVQGGSAPYSYSWNTIPVQTTATANNLSSGNYIVTVTDNGGCMATANVSIQQPLAALMVSTTQVDVLCFGGSSASATALVQGGSAPYSYSWNTIPVQTTATANNLSGGNYIVTVTDNSGCMATANVSIQQPLAALMVSTTQINGLCFGGSSASATVLVQGGSAPYSYSWNTIPAQTTATANNLLSGNYIVTVTDNSGCMATANVSIIQPLAALTVSTSQVDVLCFGNSSASATALVQGGSAPYSYSWNTIPVQTTATANNLSGGNYIVTVTDNSGCMATANVSIQQPLAALMVSTTKVDVKCFGSSSASATALAQGGSAPYSYSWNTIPVQTTATANNLSSGNYIVTVTDNSGCMATANVSIQQPLAALMVSTTQVDVLCFGSSSASATALVQGGSAPYSYSWNTVPVQTTATASNLSSGNYIVTVTDNSGCMATANVSIQQPLAALTVSTTQVNVLCFGNSSGSATALPQGGSAPYSYSWNTIPVQTTATANNLSGGNYIVTVTDNSGCMATANVSIQQPLAALMVNTLQTDVMCFGESTGSATANAQGGTAPYSYLWNTIPIQTTNTINNLRAGTYSITVTDNSGCIAIANVIINQPLLELKVNPLQTNVLCFGEASGSATASPTGGTAPYTYLWNTIPAQTTATVNNLKAGNYTVQVTDSRGCMKTANVNIVEPEPITGSAKVTIVLNGSGGSSPLIFTLGNQTNSTGIFTDVKPGVNYSWSITDGNKCNEVTGKVSLCELIIGMKIDQVNVLCFGNNTGSATVTPTGGTGPYTYSWNTIPVQTTPTASNLAAGIYTVTVKDIDGITASANVTITQPQELTGSAAITTPIKCNGETATVTLAGLGGTAPYSYTFNGLTNKTGIFSGIPAGPAYNWSITDANNCGPVTGILPVLQPAVLTGNIISKTDVTTFGGNNGSVTVAGSGGTIPYRYKLGAGAYQDSGSFNSLFAGSYVVTIQDKNLCTFDIPVTIAQPPILLGTITSQTNVPCFNGNTGSVTVAGSGGNAPYEYKLGTGVYQSSGTFNNLTAGIYTVTVRDASLSTFNIPVTITQPTSVLTVSTVHTNIQCPGEATGTASAIVAGGTEPYSYSWNSTPVQTSATISGLVAGTYIVKVTDRNGCTAESPVTIVSEKQLPNAAFTYSLSGLNTFTFVNASTNTISYLWDFGDNQASATANPVHVYSAPGTYTVKLTATNSCGSDIETQVVIVPELEFFNGFSPNGDGQNDDWNIPVLNYYPINDVTIINRWGSEVWKGINYDNKTVVWTGKNMKGEDMPDGTYYYIINYNNTEKRGWVFIKR